MEFGAAIFFTDYSMGPVELGQALEAHGFDGRPRPFRDTIAARTEAP